jgi:hypothetical protein
VALDLDLDSAYTLTPQDLALLTLLLRRNAVEAFAPHGGVEISAADYGREIGVRDAAEAWRELLRASSQLYSRQIASRGALTGSVRRVRWVVELVQTNLHSTCRISLNPMLRDFLLKLVAAEDLDLTRISTRYTVRLAELVRGAVAEGQWSVEKTISQIEGALAFAGLGTRFRELRSRVLEPTVRDFNSASKRYVIRQMEVVRMGWRARTPTHLIFRIGERLAGEHAITLNIIDEGQQLYAGGEDSPPLTDAHMELTQ